MDFVMGLPLLATKQNAIQVIVDRLAKLAQLYVKEIVRLDGISANNRDQIFQVCFLHTLQKALRTKLNFSSSYYPKIDEQTKRVNQILEDMLRACVLSSKRNGR